MHMNDLNRVKRETAKRARLGQQAKCASCGANDLRVLQSATIVLCAECRLLRQSKQATERHHPAGRHNDPAAFGLPANDHATLSDAQYDWPPETLRNPHQDPLRRMAAWLRFFIDVFRHLADCAGEWAEMLESASDRLVAVDGVAWFNQTGEA